MGCNDSKDSKFGTYHYAAPEVLMQAPPTTMSDVYSFGVLLWEVVTGTTRGPFPEMLLGIQVCIIQRIRREIS